MPFCWNWFGCQGLLGLKVKNCKNILEIQAQALGVLPDKVDANTAALVQELIGKYSEEDIQKADQNAVGLYNWVKSIIDKLKADGKIADIPKKPEEPKEKEEAKEKSQKQAALNEIV